MARKRVEDLSDVELSMLIKVLERKLGYAKYLLDFKTGG